jgi:hypothetical protein
VLGNCARLSERGGAGDPARPGAGLVAFDASCEDAISHFYNVINELRRHVSTLDKQLKSLAKDGDRPGSRGGLAKGADHAA